MERSQPRDNLFGLRVDEAVKLHLFETAKWGKFLAIIGFVFCGLMILGCIALAVSYSNMPDGYVYESYKRTRIGVVFFYLVLAVLYFFPCLYLLRFSDKMRTALTADDQPLLTTGFQNLKILFRYVGIMTIIMVALFVLLFLAGALSSL